ncbi:hypothetical protein H5410_007714 [Solanum commersonii]|uniref:O-methyltransferase n=1 Tax=Solanum commersonii TaxID=4109 RepID=A0A9J6AD76_SOLCO|nr:hypothetical protein H5410_007714 [Solanum commersonii]
MASEMFQAQAHIYKHAFSYANCMVLSCAIQLGIPDVIHSHKQPMTLEFLDENSENQQGYVLTPSSKLLLKSEIPNLSPFVRAMVEPAMVNPWQSLGVLGDKTTPFETANGAPIWEFGDQNPRFNNVFNEAMASDSEMMCLVAKDCKQVFQDMNSLVDVGGGTGVIAKAILAAFPHLKCTVLDLPQHVMHNWSDEDCVKILKKCREAIKDNKKNEGKVVIIDMVLDRDEDEDEDEANMTEVKLIYDVAMIVLLTGRERTEKEWENLFLEAGFMTYKITPLFGLRSLIEIFP